MVGDLWIVVSSEEQRVESSERAGDGFEEMEQEGLSVGELCRVPVELEDR